MTILATLAVTLAFQTAAVKGTIEGLVVRIATNEAIPRARIFTFRSDIPGDPIPAVTSDDQGRFVIKNLDPGHYSLTVEKNGFVRQAYGERRSGRGTGTPIAVRAGETVKDLVFRLVPAGAVSGRVVDEKGDAILHANVQVVKEVFNDRGERTFNGVGNALSDDRGEYRVYLLPPGRYFVRVNTAVGVRNTIDGVNSGFATTYYPGVRDSTLASPIDISPGTDLQSIDFTLREERLFRLKGRVMDPSTGKPAIQAQIRMQPRNSPAEGGLAVASRYEPASGTFEIEYVPAGSYWLMGEQFGFRNIEGAGGGIGDASNRVARVPLDVTDADIENILLTFPPDLSIPGRISFADGNSSHRIDLRAAVRATSKYASMPSSPFPSRVKPDGTFALENIQYGEYRIELNSFGPEYYLKAATLGSLDVLSGLTISGPISDELHLLVASDAGTVSGTVVDNDHKPVGGASIVLIPDYSRDRHDLYRFSVSDQNGHFQFSPAVPGDYKLFAWEDIESGAYNNPDFVRKNEELGSKMKVSEFGKLTIELKVIPASP